jgi:hypothetical protein
MTKISKVTILPVPMSDDDFDGLVSGAAARALGYT